MAKFTIKLIPDHTAINFVKYRWFGFVLSFVLIALTAYTVHTRGLNLGIDFAGGILMEIRTEEPADLSQMRALLAVPELGEVSLQNFGDDKEVLIRIEQAAGVEQAAIVTKTKALLDSAMQGIDYRKIDYVGPTVGKEMIESGFISLGLAMGAMLLYIWFRFEWQFGVGAILALTHDAIVMVGFFAITGFEFNLTSVAAILTIIGYSINDSVVIFDRIRENLRKYKKMHIDDIINKSVNETLARTVVTGVSTILAATVLAIFGGEVIRGFSVSLAFGVLIGTYSSVYISAPVLKYFKLRGETAAEQTA